MKLSSFKKTILIPAILGLAVLAIAAGLFWHFSRSGGKTNLTADIASSIGNEPSGSQTSTDLPNTPEVSPEDQIVYNDEVIPLLWTDNNDNENLIIKTDKKYYDASKEVTVYFGIANQTQSDQNTGIYFWFDDNKKSLASVEKIEGGEISDVRRPEIVDGGGDVGRPNIERKDVKGYTNGSKFTDTILAGQINYYKAVIKSPASNQQSEFFIEAFGFNLLTSDVPLTSDVGTLTPSALAPLEAGRPQTAVGSLMGYGHLDPYIAGGLVGYWSFNGADINWTSQTAYDRSGTSPANNGTITSMSTTTSPVAGINGQALSFNGTSNYVNVGSTQAAAASGSVTQANMKMSIVANTAFADFSSAGALTNYIGDKVVISDSAGKKLTGYIKAAGTGETYGGENLANTTFEDTTGLSIQFNASMSIVSGGQSGNSLQMQLGSTGDNWGQVYDPANTISSGVLLRSSAYLKKGTAGNIGFRVYYGALDSGSYVTYDWVSPSSWTQYVLYCTATGLNLYHSFFTYGSTNQTGLFDTASMVQVLTPSATGVTIVSASGGTTYTWTSEDSGFNRNDTSGYTYTIYPTNISTVSFWVKPTTTTQYAIDLDGGAHYVWINSGTVTATGFDTPTIYVDGVQTSTISNTNWHQITVTTGSSFPATNLTIGKANSNYFSGLLDEVRIYNRVLSASEVQDLYRIGAARLKVNTPKTLAGPQGGLVGNWTFNGVNTNWTSATAGTTNDLSGSYATGTMTNMSRSTSPVPGISGQALKFDGSDDRVNIGTGTNLSVTNNFTFSVWLKSNDITTSKYLYGRDSGGGGTLQHAIITGYVDNNMEFFASGYTGTDPRTNSQIIIPDLTSWHHYVYTYNGSIWSGYRDGSRVFSVSRSFSLAPTTGNVTCNLGSSAAATSFTNGLIDEFRIYNRALSASEITDLYRIGAARLKVNTPITKAGPQSGLVGNWTFNGPDINWGSNTAYDRSGTSPANNGTITNMSTTTSPVAGISGQALKFDGTDDYVDVGTNLGMTDSFTLSAWVYPGTLGASNGIIRKGVWAPTGNTNYGMDLRGTNGRQVAFFLYDSVGGAQGLIPITEQIPINQWVHIVGVYNSASTPNFKVYINGVVSVTTINWTGTMASNSVSTKIGMGDGDYFPGKIDEVRIYNRALSAQEILDLYRVGASRVKIRQ